MNIPPDVNDPNDPNAAVPTPPEPGSEFELKKKASKMPIFIAVGVVVVLVAIFAWKATQTRKTREMHAAVIQQYADIEKQEVIGKFWACLLGQGVDPGMFPNNLALAQRLESSFGTDPKNYPDKVRTECTPKAVDARKKIEAIHAPPEYDAAFKAYAQS